MSRFKGRCGLPCTKVKGHSKTGGAHKSGNDRADELAVAAKKVVLERIERE